MGEIFSACSGRRLCRCSSSRLSRSVGRSIGCSIGRSIGKVADSDRDRAGKDLEVRFGSFGGSSRSRAVGLCGGCTSIA